MRTVDRRNARRIIGRRIALALVILSVPAAAARATTVTPSDRVVNFVVVRAAPTAQSPALGKLLPGAQAEELGSLSHWLQVKLGDGTVGYVSRAWVTEIATTPTV